MKESLINFYDYLASDEELMCYIRINVEWNEESFIKMKHLINEVFIDYENEDFYPKRFIVYFVRNIPSIIGMLSRFKKCTEKELLAGYTEATYLEMIAERIEQLKKLHWEFVESLSNHDTLRVREKVREELNKGREIVKSKVVINE